MPTGKKSSVKLMQENPDDYEINFGSGPTYVPKGSQRGNYGCDIDHPEHIDRSENSEWQDYAHTSDDI